MPTDARAPLDRGERRLWTDAFARRMDAIEAEDRAAAVAASGRAQAALEAARPHPPEEEPEALPDDVDGLADRLSGDLGRWSGLDTLGLEPEGDPLAAARGLVVATKWGLVALALLLLGWLALAALVGPALAGAAHMAVEIDAGRRW